MSSALPPPESPSSFDDAIQAMPRVGDDGEIYNDVAEKKIDHDVNSEGEFVPPEEWIVRFIENYSGQHTGETLPPGSDPDRTARAVFTMNETDGVAFLKEFYDEMKTDYTFDLKYAQHIRDLCLGHEHCNMEYSDWAYETARVAGTCDNWSPYAEVRAVLLPYDDVNMPCETPRAYILGTFWVAAATLVNTCEYPRHT